MPCAKKGSRYYKIRISYFQKAVGRKNRLLFLIKLKHKISKRQTKRLYNMARDRQKSKRFYSFMEVNMQKHKIFGIIAAAIAGCGLLAGAAALGYKLCEEWR